MSDRNWTWIDDNIDEEDIEIRTPIIDSIVYKINYIEREREQRQFSRQARLENDYDIDLDEIEYNRLNQQVHFDLEESQLEALHNALYKLGAKIMRPYEHWGEEETYREYMDRDE